MNRRAMLISLFLWIILASLALGCDSSTQPETLNDPGLAPCQAGVAQLFIFDGLMQIGCGCQEPAGVAPSPPTALTCTVPVHTTVFFQYLGVGKIKHQIVPVGAASSPLGPLFDPDGKSPVRAFASSFDTAGSYPFEDVFNTQVNGVIVVH